MDLLVKAKGVNSQAVVMSEPVFINNGGTQLYDILDNSESATFAERTSGGTSESTTTETRSFDERIQMATLASKVNVGGSTVVNQPGKSLPVVVVEVQGQQAQPVTDFGAIAIMGDVEDGTPVTFKTLTMADLATTEPSDVVALTQVANPAQVAAMSNTDINGNRTTDTSLDTMDAGRTDAGANDVEATNSDKPKRGRSANS